MGLKGKRGERPAAKTNDAAAEPGTGEVAPAGAPATGDAAAGKPDTAIATYPKLTLSESIKHSYTVRELAEIAEKMGAAASRVFRIESEKGEQASHYMALLKEAHRAHAELVEKFNLRYEMRDVECRVEYDKPEPGYKSIVRTDDGEVVRELKMTDAEKQRAFVFDAGDGKPQ